jgi:putative tryptophan/tyrosine transport system substrate-binding protein
MTRRTQSGGKNEAAAMSKRFKVLLVMLLGLAFPRAGHAAKVVVLVSQNLPAYSEVTTGLSKNLNGEFIYSNMSGNLIAGKSFLTSNSSCDLVITLGPEALACAQQVLQGKPLVYTMVFKPGQYSAGPVRGVLLQVDMATQLQKIKELLPGTKKIGLVYDPRYSLPSVNQASKIAETLGLEIEALPMQDPAEIGGLLNKLKQDGIQVLWSVLDRTTMASQVIAEEIKFQLSAKIPFIGLSEYHVEAGALAAFSVDFTSIGKQTANVANTMLSKGATSAQPENPEDIMVYINNQTKKSLGLSNLPEIPNLRYKDTKQ